MAVKASNQVDLIDLTDGYSVILTSDSHTFIGGTAGVQGTQTATTQVMAFQGDEQVSCSVGTMSGQVNGISASAGTQTPAPTVTFTATSALADKGSINIPVIIGDLTINKKWSWSIAFRGADGTSVTITSTEVKYQKSTNGSTPPNGTWENDPPTPTAGQYLWTRTKVTYSDSNYTQAYSVSRYGEKGNDGTSVTVSSTEVKYASSSSGTTPPADGSTWKSSPGDVSISQGQYFWTRTKVVYSDTKTTTSYSVTRYGEDGDDALLLIISSSAGTIFKNTKVNTTLTAHVYKGGAELNSTQIDALGTVKWYKNGSYLSGKDGIILSVGTGDVNDKATYEARLES